MFTQCSPSPSSPLTGDPSVFGNLPPHPAVIEGVRLALESGKYHGYGHSSGLAEARDAVAKEFSRPGAPLTGKVCSAEGERERERESLCGYVVDNLYHTV